MRWAIIIAMLLGMWGCKTSSKLSSSNLSEIYKLGGYVLNPDYQIYHRNDTLSGLFFSINTDELLYAKLSEDRPFEARVRLSYQLLKSYETSEILDSSSVVLGDEQSGSGRKLIGELPFKPRSGSTYLLMVELTDLQRKKSIKKYITVDKLSGWSRQNFMVNSTSTGLPLFRDYLDAEEEVVILHNDKQTQQLQVRYYKREFPLAPPPFSMHNLKPFNYDADSIFYIEAVNDSFVVQLPQVGFYHFVANQDSKAGLTLYRFKGGFPDLNGVEDLIGPLRYITSKKEYENIKNAENQKKALDEFWLENSINPDRARELLKEYYVRVEEANHYFTSYIEGWRTDRGMVYMIFGPPNVIYKTTNSETWIYGEESNFMSINFIFVKVTNPFTRNDFSLSRSPVLKQAWYRAVDSWREGRIYTN